MRKLLFAVWFILVASSHAVLAATYDVKVYGATGNGKSLDTEAINKAIEAAAKAGGGTVNFPAGTYLCFSIHLKSNIILYLQQGATILAAIPRENVGYDEPEAGAKNKYQDFGHSHWHNSLIWGENLKNISILGPGIIYGKGLNVRGSYKGLVGNKAIALKLCTNVILKDFTILYGGHFGLLATGVDSLFIDNLKMDTNRDGINIDCCRNVHISNCVINSPWDDAICLKSSYGLGFARATENVTITNCKVTGFDRGTYLDGTYKRDEYKLVPDGNGPTGRIKFGTESNGGFKNITVSNCVFEFCRGLALETVDGGLLEDVTITEVTMRDIINSPIFLRLGGRMRGPAHIPIGKLRRITISNLVVYNANSRFASIISGLPGNDIEDVKLNNIKIFYKTVDSAEIKIQKVIREYKKAYPEPQSFGIMPAYGFYIRHAKNIELENVELGFSGKETRPAFFLTDVKGIKMYNVNAQKPAKGAIMVLKNVSGFESKGGNMLKKSD